jgi:glycosidase
VEHQEYTAVKSKFPARIVTLTLAALLVFPSLTCPRDARGASPETGTRRQAELGPIYEVNLEYFPNHSFNELAEQMPRLKKLGIRIICLLPIWDCLGAQQYLIADYDKINQRYGTAADLKALVATAHQHGVRVLLDLVTSITYDGSSIAAQHRDWFLHDTNGKPQRYFPFPVFGWALDCTHPQVIAYFTQIARRYVEEFDTDGWRVDSPANNYDPAKVPGDHTRTPLLRAVKAAITQAKPSAILIAENTGPEWCTSKPPNDNPPVFDEMCEAAYNYAICGFMGGSKPGDYHYVVPGPWDNPKTFQSWTPTILDAVAHSRGTSKEFVDTVLHAPILDNRLRANFIENHDTARVSEGFPDQHRALFLLIATMPGVPVVHAGEEIGVKTHPQPATVKQSFDFSAGDQDLEAFYRHVLQIRAANAALREGDFLDVWEKGDNAIAFLRSSGANHVITALNFSGNDAHCILEVPIETLGGKTKAPYTLHDELSDENFRMTASGLKQFELTLKPYGYRVLSITTRK